MEDVKEYYAHDYDILVESEDEDQIYEVRAGVPFFRTQHQLSTLLRKVELFDGMRLLDYGCAKGATMRLIAAKRPHLNIHLFDVSERYLGFWRSFVPESNWSINTLKADWRGSFDLVTSFFSLEHIPRPIDTLYTIAELLRPGGLFYCVVPHVLTNPADLIVADHPNHFTIPSVDRLLRTAGLNVQEIDSESHRGALVVLGSKSVESVPRSQHVSPVSPASALMEIGRIASFWMTAGNRIRQFENSLGHEPEIAIYGAGFYGKFIFTSMRAPERTACFVDQNPFLRGKSIDAIRVVHPSDLPPGIRSMLVGLNPTHAREIIADIPALARRPLRYFYL